MRLHFLFFLLLGFLNAQAQFTHTFTEKAHNTNYGKTEDTAVDNNGTVFVAYGIGGLRAYSYNDNVLTNTAHINDGGEAANVEVGPDGTIFLISHSLTDSDRLTVYKYNGTSFIRTANLDVDGNISDLKIGQDGTIFLAHNGIHAYRLDGNILNNTANMDTIGYECIAISPDGTIFLTGDAGLGAFNYNGSSFINTAYIDAQANNISIGPDSTVFLSGFQLSAYHYNGSSFENTALITWPHWTSTGQMSVVSNDTLIVILKTFGSDSLCFYEYDGESFINLAQINIERGSQFSVDTNGMIFLADGGVTGYKFNSSSISRVAHIDDGGSALDAVAIADSIVFLANSTNLFVYNYNGVYFSEMARIESPGVNSVAIGKDETLFLTCGDGLYAYQYDGASYLNTAHINNEEEVRDIVVGWDGTIFLASFQGLSAYSYNGNSFINTAQVFNGIEATGVEVGFDGTIFVANMLKGLQAYSYDGNSFNIIAGIYNGVGVNKGDWVTNVKIASDGTIFLAYRYSGLWAYTFDGNSFSAVARIDNGGQANDVAIGPDGTIFLLVHYPAGLRAYSFNGNSFTNTAFIDEYYGESSNWDIGVTVGSDGTVFLSSGDAGLIAYDYSMVNTISDNFYNPEQFVLHQNYPNPFNPTTNIAFSIPMTEFVTLKIYNVLGKQVATILSEKLNAGDYHYSWNAGSLSSGVYIYKLEAGNFVESRKMILMR